MGNEVRFDEAQQVLVDKLVGDARVKARERAQTELAAQAAKDKEAAAQTALAAEAKWQELAEQHAARVKELEPLVGKAAEFDKLIDGMLKDKLKAMGDAAKKAVGALPEQMSKLDQLNWLNANAGLFTADPGDGVGTPRHPKKQPVGDKKAEKPSKHAIRL